MHERIKKEISLCFNSNQKKLNGKIIMQKKQNKKRKKKKEKIVPSYDSV